MEKTCENCEDYIVCLQTTGKEPKKVCSDWKLDFMTYQNMMKEATKGVKDINEIEKIAKGILNK